MPPQLVEINKTGMYFLYFMYCDPQLKGTTISGRTVWQNPDGYLPGKMVPLMTFYGFMSLAYLILGLGWFLRFVKFWKDIMQLHYHISAVIALGMCEMAFWYFDYSNISITGSRPVGITIWAVTISVIKKTISRLLLLVVAMGYGVVRPTLGGVTSKVLILGAVYFVASEALELVENLGNINDFSGRTKLYLVLPVAFLDAWFILWIFLSLPKTLEKLQLYASFGLLLAIPPVNRIEARSDQFDMYMQLDVNTDIYPMHIGDKFMMVLATTLNLDGTPDSGFFTPGGRKSLADKFEYVMHGSCIGFLRKAPEPMLKRTFMFPLVVC